MTRRPNQTESEYIEELETALEEIEQWCDAYPDRVFTPLRGDPIAKTGDYDTDEKRNLITRASASMARHCMRGVARITRLARNSNAPFTPDRGSVAEINQWKGIGRRILNSLEDWSTGDTSRNVFISENEERTLRQLLGDE